MVPYVVILECIRVISKGKRRHAPGALFFPIGLIGNVTANATTNPLYSHRLNRADDSMNLTDSYNMFIVIIVF